VSTNLIPTSVTVHTIPPISTTLSFDPSHAGNDAVYHPENLSDIMYFARDASTSLPPTTGWQGQASPSVIELLKASAELDVLATRAPDGHSSDITGGNGEPGSTPDLPSTTPSSSSTTHPAKSSTTVAAIAVFALVAFVILLIWFFKRWRRRHEAPLASILPTIAQKPELVEVKLSSKTVIYPSDAKWEYIMPLSAKYIPHEVYVLEQASVASSASSQYTAASRPTSILTQSSTSSTLSGSSWKKVSAKEEEGRVRVAITIAMPSPRGGVIEKGRDAVEEPALCLGVADVPWHSDVFTKQV